MTVPVEIVNISRKYDHVWALRNFTVRIDEGESVAVLGSNGAGKSTFIRILATHILPSSGEVKIYGRNLNKEIEKTKRLVGFVAHESFLYDELTAEENLRFYGKLFSVDEKDIHRMIELLSLDDWAQIPVKQLSHGLRKRVDIARALLHDPKLILLDELFAGLDEKTRIFLVEYFKALSGKTLVVSSHSREWAQQLCSRSLFMDKGRLVKDSSLR